MIAVGTTVALPIAWALRRLVEAQLFGVRPFDAQTIVFASLILGDGGAWRRHDSGPARSVNQSH